VPLRYEEQLLCDTSVPHCGYTRRFDNHRRDVRRCQSNNIAVAWLGLATEMLRNDIGIR